MSFEQIYTYLIAALPSITAIVGIVTACVKIIKQFKALRDEVKETQDIKEVSEQLKVVLEENAELKKSMTKLNNTVMTKIDHLYVEEPKDEK